MSGGETSIQLTYYSGWSNAFLHFQKNRDKWTNPPGIPWEKVADGVWKLKLEAEVLEFVCTNGASGWDKPPHGGNYLIETPGDYELRNGRINRITVAKNTDEKRDEKTPVVQVVSSASMFRQKSLSLMDPVPGGMPRNSSQGMLRSGSRFLDSMGGGGIRLTYHTGWPTCFLHGCKDGEAAWTQLPGIPWKANASGIMELKLEASSLEFVCTNGAGGWDKPPGGGNYRIDGPGQYMVKNGRVKRVLPPPLPPNLVVVHAVGPAAVELAWNPPNDEDGLVGYRIYHAENSKPVGQTSVDVRNFTATLLKGATKYSFVVTAINEDEVESPGTSVEATTSTPGKPSAPTFLQVVSHSTEHIALSWAPPHDMGGASVTAYHVFRDGIAVDTVFGRNPETDEDFKILHWKDTKVEKGTEYHYCVSAMHLPNRSPSRSDLCELLEKRASHSLLEVAEEDNEGPSCEEVAAKAVTQLSMPKLGEQTTHVILQGFNWWSCQNKNGWYNVLSSKVQDFKRAGFDMVWLPPPAQSADLRGYLPSQWYNLNSCYGSQDEIIALGKAFTESGICPILDLVVNHRCASKKDDRGRWTVFEKPEWGPWAICRNDQSGAGEGAMSTGELLEYAPDIDHTNPKVQQDVKDWVSWMFKEVGIKALRLDFVIGFSPHFQEQYVRAAGSPFAVAEYWHGDVNVLKNYVNATKGAVAVFDFPVYYTLKNSVRSNDFSGLNCGGKPPGMMGCDPTRCCSFVENHDTDHLEVVGGCFGNNEQIVRGYVYILTHPGVPTVFWTDWSDRGQSVQQQIERCVQIRFERGLHCLSRCSIAVAEGGLYAAYVDGKKGGIAMKLGNRDWSPNGNCWSLAASGDGYCVWVRS